MGEFSALKDLPDTYRNCQSNEDKDMTFFDFITDHLINIDAVFDQHVNGDHQRPHCPIPNQQHCQKSNYLTSHFTFSILWIYSEKNDLAIYSELVLMPDNFSRIFRPPIV